VKILLDENLPRKLVAALRADGHETESVHTLRMQGLENGKLYAFACQNFEICFTRDAGFTHNARQPTAPPKFKLLRVILPQKPQDEFVAEFLVAFRATNWAKFSHGDDWPAV
jgi:predicted nuclease of predicted toxin-antitoxin system